MNQIEVKVRFRAGHRLMPPYKGKCNNPHGEGYTSIFIFSGEVDERGLLIDFGEVKSDIKILIDEVFDHSYMHKKGDIIGKILKTYGFKTYEMEDNPTAENISHLLYKMVKNLYPALIKVGIVESFEDSIAWYEEGEDKKRCHTCNKAIDYSEYCLFHFKKRRDFCSKECYKKFCEEPYFEKEKKESNEHKEIKVEDLEAFKWE